LASSLAQYVVLFDFILFEKKRGETCLKKNRCEEDEVYIDIQWPIWWDSCSIQAFIFSDHICPENPCILEPTRSFIRSGRCSFATAATGYIRLKYEMFNQWITFVVQTIDVPGCFLSSVKLKSMEFTHRHGWFWVGFERQTHRTCGLTLRIFR
jgi:hypothetical protein